MSTQMDNRDAMHSVDCPVVDGQRQIQHVSPRTAEVGGITIHRVLPSRHRRLVGPWCFLDHAGPAVFQQTEGGMRVGPHPHIGLQTFTWMIEGRVLHRDSLGNEQVIQPGQVNLMTAGRGISHTEESLTGETRLHAAQLWIALPREHRDTPPRFDHYPELPRWASEHVTFTLLAGKYQHEKAPTLTFSALVGLDMSSQEGGDVTLQLREDFEYAVLPLAGECHIEDERFGVNEMAYLGRGRTAVTVTLPVNGHAILIGGRPLNSEVLIWWNFVGHDKDEIIQAQQEWEMASERFGTVAGHEEARLMPPPLPWAS